MRVIYFVGVLSTAVSFSSFADGLIPAERQGTWQLPWTRCTSNEQVVVKNNSVQIKLDSYEHTLTDFMPSHSFYGRGDPDGHMFAVMPNPESELSNYILEFNDITGDLIFKARKQPNGPLSDIADMALIRCK